MDIPGPILRREASAGARPWPGKAGARREAPVPGAERVTSPAKPLSFHDWFVEQFNAHFPRLYRYLDRLSGEPELAADVAQDAFVRLYRRGSPPEIPVAWLISVALNLLRNAQSTRRRRHRLLTAFRAEDLAPDPPPTGEERAVAGEARRRVRATLDRLPERERRLLLLRAEGYSYRELAAALELNEASVGTLLARARAAFRAADEGEGGG